jgi:O-succinylbenzoate synthase
LAGHTRDTVDEAWELLSKEGRRILGGDDPVLIEGSSATSAMDEALTSLRADHNGAPLATEVGGGLDPVAASAAIGLGATLSDVIGAVASAVDAGHSHVKLKIDPGRLHWVDVVRKDFPDLGLAIDPNGSFRRADFGDLVALDALQLEYVEQPLSPLDLPGHATLQARMSTPICLDESVKRLGDVVTIAASGAARAVSLKPGRLGPSLTSRGIALAARHGIDVKIGGLVETGVGKTHAVALASHPHVSLPSDLAASAHWFAHDLVTPPWTVKGGVMTPPTDSGLGVAVDRAYLDEIATRHIRLPR